MTRLSSHPPFFTSTMLFPMVAVGIRLCGSNNILHYLLDNIGGVEVRLLVRTTTDTRTVWSHMWVNTKLMWKNKKLLNWRNYILRVHLGIYGLKNQWCGTRSISHWWKFFSTKVNVSPRQIYLTPSVKLKICQLYPLQSVRPVLTKRTSGVYQ